MEFLGNIQIWDQQERTENCYNWFEYYLNKNYDKNLRFDYSESLFFNDFNIQIEKATLNKYEYIFTQLELQSGQRLLDCGCGIGTWMEYCTQRGVQVIGLTLSEEQAKVVKNKGLTVYVRDYRLKYDEFINYFDAISALGSAEHICTSQGVFTHAETRCKSTHEQLYNLFKSYLKPNGKILTTLLTLNNIDYSFYDYIQVYILERHFGGYYVTEKNLMQAITNAKLKIISKQDFTKDYHWTSVAAPEHFGHWSINWNENPVEKLLYLLQGLITDPFLIHHWLYYFMDTWMWQFGGYQKTPLSDKQVAEAPFQLKYITISL